MNTGKAIFIVVGAFALGYAGTIAYRQFMLLKETDFKIQSVKKNIDKCRWYVASTRCSISK